MSDETPQPVEAPQLIPVPPKAAAQITAILQRRAAIETELQQAAALVVAAIGAPDGWQLRIEPDGGMVAVEPAPV